MLEKVVPLKSERIKILILQSIFYIRIKQIQSCITGKTKYTLLNKVEALF